MTEPARGPRRAFIVSHTHWDREWYRTFHDFRGDLTRVVRQVLDALESDGAPEVPEGDAAFRHFVLDGQAVVLEDHLEIHPEDRPRIEALVRAGRLAVGPWYILPDEFLVSGEATVRNLVVGRHTSLAVGGVQPVGYMPDSFGHIAQMPQLLRRSGIDSFVYTRGHGDEIDRLGLEYRWQAPDGSEVLAINQCGGYANAASLGHEEIWHAHTQRAIDVERAVSQVRELFAKMGARSRSRVWLLNNGCDHFPPQRDFARVLDALRAAFPDTEFIHAGLADYVAALRAEAAPTEVWRGELLGGKQHHILSGVWSARMPLKQRNDACEELLAGTAEPLLAYAHFMLGLDYPQGALEYAWKLLLRNHPHDSICGCSIDEVHREMLTRFDGVEQTTEQLLRRCLETIAPTFARHAEDDGETLIAIANPLPETRTAVVERLVVLQPPGADPARLRLVDESGADVPFVVRERQFVERFWGIDYRRELDAARQRTRFDVYRERFGDRILRDETRRADSDCFLWLEFVARDLPPLGHRDYRLTTDGTIATAPSGPVRGSANTIENEHVRVRLYKDGTLDLTLDPHGAAPRTWAGLNRLEDGEDVGDEYDHSPAEQSEIVHLAAGDPAFAGGDVALLHATPFSAALEARAVWRLPAAIAGDRKARTIERVACPVAVRVAVRAGDPVVAVDVRFDNRVRDHRLRAAFPGGIKSARVLSDGQFLVQDRPLRPPTGEGWVQPSPGTWPQQEFSFVADGAAGLAVLNRGLPELEADTDADGEVTLRLTLLRAVDWLSRDDFPTRRHQNAGPTLHTPDAQCLGPQRLQYGLLPFEVAGPPATAVQAVKAASRAWRTPPLTIQGVADRAIAGTDGLLSHASTATSVSAIKRHDRRPTLVVRLYNLGAEPVRETLTLGREIAAAWRVDLHEEREAPLEVQDGRQVLLDLGAHAIETVEIAFARRSSSTPGVCPAPYS